MCTTENLILLSSGEIVVGNYAKLNTLYLEDTVMYDTLYFT